MTAYPNATQLAAVIEDLDGHAPGWLVAFLTATDGYCRHLAKRADHGIGRALPVHGGLWIQIGPWDVALIDSSDERAPHEVLIEVKRVGDLARQIDYLAWAALGELWRR